jgi:hypothetical protein
MCAGADARAASKVMAQLHHQQWKNPPKFDAEGVYSF